MVAHLNERQRRIISLLAHTHSPVTGAQIARELGISLRTVQHEVSRINSDETLIASSNRGYELTADVRQSEPGESVNDPVTDVLRIVARDILINRKALLVEDLAEELYLSRSSLERALVSVRSQIASYGLVLKRSRGLLTLSGSTEARHELISKLLMEEARHGQYAQGATESMSVLLDLGFVREALERCAAHEKCHVEPGYEEGLTSTLAIALFSMRQVGASTGTGSSTASLPEAPDAEHAIATSLCQTYATKWPIRPLPEDIQQIASLLAGQVRPEFASDDAPRIVNDALVEQVEGAARKALEPYGVRVERNRTLVGLALHVGQLLRRPPNSQLVDRGVLEGIQRSYPFVFEVTQLFAQELSRRFSLEVCPGELGFLCIHLGLLVGGTDPKLLRLGLFDETYQSVANSLRDGISRRYPDQLEVVIYHSANALVSDANSGLLDFVATTGDPITLPIPCVRISPLLVPDDLLSIGREIVSRAEWRRSQQRRSTRGYFSPSLFACDNTGNLCRDDVISMLCQRLVDEGVVDDSFERSVRAREAAGSTCFFGRFAIPHSIEMNARATRFCALVSKPGIDWNGAKVHVVLMIAVRREDRGRFMALFDTAVKALSDEARLSAIARTTTLEGFLSALL